MSAPEIPSIDLLGLKISRVNRAEAREALLRFIQSGEPHLVVTADASMHVIASGDRELLQLVNEADLVTPDSTGVLWAARKLGTPLEERVSGVELAEMLCAESAQRGFSLYFFGAAPGVAEDAAEVMRRRYPGCRIVGTAHGFLSSPEEQRALLDDIREKRPAVLLVAMGIPRQEKWIRQHMDELRVPVNMGVGGTFDVFSGRVDRAPLWMQRNGLEWLYRLLRNPSKYSKVATLPVFMLRVLRRQRL
ncbi:MAG: WecB/TagA/CpsF family glycosyltransferase [Armatimonadota bacterium]